MTRRSGAEAAFRANMAQAIRRARLAVGWSQRRLGEYISVSQSLVWTAESGGAGPSLHTLFAMCEALGVSITIDYRFPLVARSSTQRDPVHARCVAYVARRLIAAGYLVVREVEIIHGRSHGWIDVLAYAPRTGLLLVIEVKTVLDDVGAVERQLAWYRREAWASARRMGWRPRRVLGWLLVLATEQNDAMIKANREALSQTFPGRAGAMVENVQALAMIDPSSRRQEWLIRTVVDGRRSAAPYVDYADFLRRREVRAGRRAA
jgi:transcriptional regulator with XRE-family HTH domain